MESKLDPVTFEVLMHRLETILGEGYSTIGRVSGSAVVYEAGDHQEAILTRDGELAAFGGGVLHWTPVMSSAVKHIIETFGFDEIHEGAYFLQNDPYIGCLHAMDMQLTLLDAVQQGVHVGQIVLAVRYPRTGCREEDRVSHCEPPLS